MANLAPVFSVSMEIRRIPAPISYSIAEQFLLDQFDREKYWVSSSRNWWHQDLMAEMCKAQPEYRELHYLSSPFEIVSTEHLARKSSTIQTLLTSLDKDPQWLADLLSKWWGGESTADQIRGAIGNSLSQRNVHDNELDLQTFFAFLKSQMSVLSEAHLASNSLIYLQVDKGRS
jgi:hypothetical protein